jgi:cytochrome P450
VPNPLTPPNAWDHSSFAFLPALLRAPLAVLPPLIRDPLAFLTGSARKYGDVVRFGVRPRAYLVSHPDLVKYVLQDHHQNYIKGKPYAFLKKVIGTALLAADGDEWRRHRRLVQPAYHREHHPVLARAIQQGIDALMKRWDRIANTGSTVSLRDEMVALTLDILMRSLFSTDLGDQMPRLRAAFLEVDSHISLAASALPVHLPRWVPTPRNMRFNRAMRALDEFIGGVFRSRREATVHRADLLSLLVDARDEDTGVTLSEAELRDEVIATMRGGYEPLSDALTWAFYVLTQQPSLGERLPDDPAFTTLFIHEVLRLYPSAWGFGRTAVEEDTIGEYRVPAGALIVLSPWVVHRDPRWWEAPDVFDPDRFSPERSSARPKFAYFPFAAGPRMCIGRDFAMMEAQLILAALCRCYRVEFAPGPTFRPVARYGLEPNAPMIARIFRRVSSRTS